MTRFLARRTPRERVLLATAALVLPALVLWQAVWAPLDARLGAARAEVARLDALIHVAAQASPAAVARPAAADAPLTRRVTQAAAQAGIALSRLDPDGASLRVAVADAEFDALLAWIAAMQAEHAVQAARIEATRLAAPGRVRVDLTLEDDS